MDRRGNFRFRMQSRRKVFVGYKKTEDSGGQLKPVVDPDGGWFAWLTETPISDAWHMMLAQYSLGHCSIC